MENQSIMIMVGPDGVGKTTLLATMYHELSHQEETSGFKLVASPDTHHDLVEAYHKLSHIITQPTFTPTGPLLKGTAGIVERQFKLLFRQKTELTFVLYDIAGGLIRAETEENRADDPDLTFFKTQLEQALVIIYVIDGSALIEGDDLTFQQKNEPRQVEKLLGATLAQQSALMILFVVTKCEAWLKNQASRKQLEQSFETQYQSLLSQIARQTNVVAVLMPVKTLGCVEFTRIDRHNNRPEMIFIRKPNLQFQPENTDQPLRYALAYTLSQHEQKRSPWHKWLRRFLSKDIAFQKALYQFAQARDHSFKIYGNTSLIEITPE
jgi:GTPase SAR1 family protein